MKELFELYCDRLHINLPADSNALLKIATRMKNIGMLSESEFKLVKSNTDIFIQGFQTNTHSLPKGM